MEFFLKSEFRCQCGCGLGFRDMDKSALTALGIARSLARVPFFITSSIRCAKHNKKAGGSDTSSHLIGCAFDIKCEDSTTRMKMMAAFLNSPFTRVGIAKNFIHIDCDQRKPQYLIWTY